MSCRDGKTETNKTTYSAKRVPQRKLISFPFSFLYPSSAIHGQAPTLAAEPPTIRVFETLVNPHPSLGVSKRPVMSEPK